MTDTDEYCVKAFASRSEQYDELFKGYDEAWDAEGTADDDREEWDTKIDQSILAVDQYRGFRVQISFGGPSEWLDCRVDEDGDLVSVTFHAAWWSTPTDREVDEDSGLWRLAERFNPFEGL